MKLLFVTDSMVNLCEPYVGGTEVFVVSLSNALSRRGHQVDVIARSTDENNRFHLIKPPESPLRMESTAYDETVGQRYYGAFQYGLMDTSSYDVIHYNSYAGEMFEMGMLHNNPAVVTLHVGRSDRLTAIYQLFCNRTRATTVGVSHRTRSDWRAYLPDEPHLITNGVDLDEWPVHERPSDGYLLWSGRIGPDKNPLAAIQLAQHLGVPLKLIGPIFDKDYFATYIEPRLTDEVEYVGHMSHAEMNTLAAGARAFLATATWDEPFGLATVEMLASGLPVVGFTSAIPPELRIPGICEATDSTDWHDLIDPLKSLGRTNSSDCRTAAEKYSVENMTDEYEQLYQSLCRTSREQA